MARPAALIQARLEARLGQALGTPVSRYRRAIEWDHPAGGGRRILVASQSPVHLEDGTTEISTDWIPGDPILDAPWLWKTGPADYRVRLGPGTTQLSAGQLLEVRDQASGQVMTFTPAQLQWTSSTGGISPIADPLNLAVTTLAGDRATWIGGYGAGWDYSYITQSARIAKHLRIATAATLGSPPPFMNGLDPHFNLRFIVTFSSGIQVWTWDNQVGQYTLWDQRNNTERLTDRPVELRSAATGEVIWTLPVPYAWEESGTREPGLGRLYLLKRPQEIQVAVRIPWTWLQAATFPVVVDPTVNPKVGASGDDAVENTTGAVTTNPINARLNSSSIWNGFRWVINASGTVNAADLGLVGDHPSLITYGGTLRGVAEDSCAAWNGVSNPTFDISGRADTSASTLVNITLNTSAYVSTPDLADEIQEIFNRSGWASGNYLGLTVQWDSGIAGNAQWTAFNDDATEAAQLTIDYTAGGAQAGAFTLARTAGLAQAPDATAAGALALAVVRAVAQSGVATAAADLSLGLDRTATWTGAQVLGLAFSLARSGAVDAAALATAAGILSLPRVAGQAQAAVADALAALGLDRSAAEAVAELVTATGSLAVDRTAADVYAAAQAILAQVDLDRAGGLALSGQGLALAAAALLRSGALFHAALATADGQAALARLLAVLFSGVTEGAQEGALTLARTLDQVLAGEALGDGQIALARADQVDQVAQALVTSQLSLAAIFGLAFDASEFLVTQAALSLARTAGQTQAATAQSLADLGLALQAGLEPDAAAAAGALADLARSLGLDLVGGTAVLADLGLGYSLALQAAGIPTISATLVLDRAGALAQAADATAAGQLLLGLVDQIAQAATATAGAAVGVHIVRTVTWTGQTVILVLSLPADRTILVEPDTRWIIVEAHRGQWILVDPDNTWIE